MPDVGGVPRRAGPHRHGQAPEVQAPGALLGGHGQGGQLTRPADDLLREVRAICLRFPETVEQETWGHPTFRVRGKIFALVGVIDPGDGDRAAMTDRGGAAAMVSMSMKAPPGEQDLLLAEGDPFFFPPYVGPRGWIGVVLGERTDFAEIAELVEDSYRLVAPKRLVARLDA